MNLYDDSPTESQGASMRSEPNVEVNNREIQRRQFRRRAWERFEFAFFVGLMMTMILVGITVMASHLWGSQDVSGQDFLHDGPSDLMVINLDPEPVKAPPVDLGEDDHDAFILDTSWIDEGTSLHANPYVTPITQTSIATDEPSNPYAYNSNDLDLKTDTSSPVPQIEEPPASPVNSSKISTLVTIEAYLPTKPEIESAGEAIGAIRYGGRSGDVRTVYRFPSLVWGKYP